MNYEYWMDLKDAWNNDEPSGTQFAQSTARRRLKQPSAFVAKIRKLSCRKFEFIATIVFYLASVYHIAYISKRFFFNAICILLFVIMMLNAYYAFGFMCFIN